MEYLGVILGSCSWLELPANADPGKAAVMAQVTGFAIYLSSRLQVLAYGPALAVAGTWGVEQHRWALRPFQSWMNYWMNERMLLKRRLLIRLKISYLQYQNSEVSKNTYSKAYLVSIGTSKKGKYYLPAFLFLPFLFHFFSLSHHNNRPKCSVSKWNTWI